MIKHVDHNRIDKKKWDDCIQGSPNGMVYAFSWFLDLVSPGWNALIEGDYETVFPLTWRKKYGYQYLYQPFFTQQLGIFSVKKAISGKTAGEFLEAVPEQYRLIEIQLNTQNSITKKDFRISERITHHLGLDQSYEKIYLLYSDNLKRNIKRAYKNKIELFSVEEPSGIIQLFKQNKGKDVATLKKNDYAVLQELIIEAGKRKRIFMLGAKSGNKKLCAGAVFLQSNHEYIFLFSAADEEARNTGAMSLLLDFFIRTHAGERMNLDFEGSMDKNLARFYKSFGSKEVVYLQIRKNRLPAYVKWIKK